MVGAGHVAHHKGVCLVRDGYVYQEGYLTDWEGFMSYQEM